MNRESSSPPASSSPDQPSDAERGAPKRSASGRARAKARAPAWILIERSLAETGPGCVATGDVREIRGTIRVRPFGKGTDGVLLDDGEKQWFVAYKANELFRDLAGQTIEVRGRECDKRGAAVSGSHFAASALRRVASSGGDGPTTKDLARTSSDLVLELTVPEKAWWIGYGTVYSVRIEEVIEGSVPDSSLAMTILTANRQFDEALAEAASDGVRIEIGFRRKGTREERAMVPISGFVDGNRTSWKVHYIERP